jgi:hypothetical protein
MLCKIEVQLLRRRRRQVLLLILLLRLLILQQRLLRRHALRLSHIRRHRDRVRLAPVQVVSVDRRCQAQRRQRGQEMRKKVAIPGAALGSADVPKPRVPRWASVASGKCTTEASTHRGSRQHAERLKLRDIESPRVERWNQREGSLTMMSYIGSSCGTAKRSGGWKHRCHLSHRHPPHSSSWFDHQAKLT